MSKVDYREILRLHELGHSQNRIAGSVGSSCHTIKAVLDSAAAKNIMWPLDNDISNQDLELLLFPGKYKAISMYEESDYAYIHCELAKPGVTLTLLWEEY